MTLWETRSLRLQIYLILPFVENSCFVATYMETSKKPFPYPLVFLILPIILHKKTRTSISKTTREQLHVWIRFNQEIKIGLSKRIKDLIPFTKEAMTFLIQMGNLEINSDAGLIVNKYTIRKIPKDYTKEVDDCLKKSIIVGRWFARSGNPTTIFSMFGVRP